MYACGSISAGALRQIGPAVSNINCLPGALDSHNIVILTGSRRWEIYSKLGRVANAARVFFSRRDWFCVWEVGYCAVRIVRVLWPLCCAKEQ